MGLHTTIFRERVYLPAGTADFLLNYIFYFDTRLQKSWFCLSIRPKLPDQDQSWKTSIKTKTWLAGPRHRPQPTRPRQVFVGLRPVFHKTEVSDHITVCQSRPQPRNFKCMSCLTTRGQSNLTKSASRGAHSPVRGHPRVSKFVPLNSWGRGSY